VPEFFVWLRPLFTEIIEAPNEQAAAEAFLDLPATTTPQAGMAPDCFVQARDGRPVPRSGRRRYSVLGCCRR
jgi:hypothetical protein